MVVRDALIEPFARGKFNSTMHIPVVPYPVVMSGGVLVSKPGHLFVLTNMMTGDFQHNDTSGPGQFPFSAKIIINSNATGSSNAAIVRHIDSEATEAYRKMGFFEGWRIADDQLDALATTL